jgi:hypothetical protein
MVRQIHRWVSVAFTLAFLANIVALSLGHGQQPPAWVTYSPLLPLFALLCTGMYLFVLPYLSARKQRTTT